MASWFRTTWVWQKRDSEIENVAGAVEVLRRMRLLPGDEQGSDGMAHYDEAAKLLEKKGHFGEAVEFLNALTRGVPWNAAYSLRLAQAKLRTANDKAQTLALLSSVAADANQSYDLRVQAALLMRGEANDATKLGSEELRLLALGKATASQAQHPYFTAARITAADSLSDASQRAELLREAVAISPAGIGGAKGFSGEDLRLKIFQAEVGVKHEATALEAIEPLLKKENSYSGVAEDDGVHVAPDGESAAEQGGDASAEMSEEAGSTGNSDKGRATLAELERFAPLPGRNLEDDAAKLALAALIAQVYERVGNPANALPYLRLAAYLEKDPRVHTEMLRHIDELDIALKLETQNALRRPKIERALNQSTVVRPRLHAADLSSEPSDKGVR